MASFRHPATRRLGRFTPEELRELDMISYNNFCLFNWNVFEKAAKAGRFAVNSRMARQMRQYGITKRYAMGSGRRQWFTPDFIQSDYGKELNLEPVQPESVADRYVASHLKKLAECLRGEAYLTREFCAYGLDILLEAGYIVKGSRHWQFTPKFLKEHPEAAGQ